MTQCKTERILQEERDQSNAVCSLGELLESQLLTAAVLSFFLCLFAIERFDHWELKIRYLGHHPFILLFLLILFAFGLWQNFKALKEREPLLKKYQWSVSDYLALGLGTYCVQCVASIVIVWMSYVWAESLVVPGTNWSVVQALLPISAIASYYTLKHYLWKWLDKICPMRLHRRDSKTPGQGTVLAPVTSQGVHTKISEPDSSNTLSLERIPLKRKTPKPEPKWRMLLPSWSKRLFDQTENALGIVFFVGIVAWGAVLFYHYVGALDWWLDFRNATTRFLGTTAIVALTILLTRLVIYFVPVFIFFYLRDGLYWTWYQALALVTAPIIALIPWYLILSGMEWLRHSGFSLKKSDSTSGSSFVWTKDRASGSEAFPVQSAKVSVGEELLSETSSESFASTQMEKDERSSLGQGQTAANEKDSVWGSLAGIALLSLIVVGMVAVAVKSTNSVSSSTVSAVRPVVQNVNLPPKPQLFVPSTWTQDFLEQAIAPQFFDTLNKTLHSEWIGIRRIDSYKIDVIAKYYNELQKIAGINKRLASAVWRKKNLFSDNDDAQLFAEQLQQVCLTELNLLQLQGIVRLSQPDLNQLTRLLTKMIKNLGDSECASFYRGHTNVRSEDMPLSWWQSSLSDFKTYFSLSRKAVEAGLNGETPLTTMTNAQWGSVFKRLVDKATRSPDSMEHWNLVAGFNDTYETTTLKHSTHTCRVWTNILWEATKLTGTDAQFLRLYFQTALMKQYGLVKPLHK